MSMTELFEAAFRRYGHIGKYPRLSNHGIIHWLLYSYLHGESFNFFVEKPKSVPMEIKDNRILFMGFLAGYTDGEGSLGIYPIHKYIHHTINIQSEDTGILKDTKEKLTEYGYHPVLYLAHKKGRKSGYGTLNKDFGGSV